MNKNKFTYFIIIGLMLVTLLSCASRQATLNKNSYEIKYRIDFERSMSEMLLEEFKKNKTTAEANKQIEIYQNPKSEHYTLSLGEDVSELIYVESIDNSQSKSNITVRSFPLGKNTLRKLNDSLIYYKHNIGGKDYYSKDSLITSYWKETGRDSILLGYKVSEIELKSKVANFKAWYTNKLPKGMGIYNLSFDKGFILAYEIYYAPNKAFDKNIMRIYPYNLERKNLEINIPTIDKIHTMNEIKSIYAEQNKLLNQAVEVTK